MPSKAQIKLIRSLHLKKYRKEHRLFVAEGTVNVLDFLENDAETVNFYATEKWLKKFGSEINISPETVPTKVMAQMTHLKTPSEVLAVFKIPENKPLYPNDINDLVLALDNINDPGNLGTIIRTADWFGIKNIVCSHETVDAFNPKVVQATMGSLMRVNITYSNLKEFFSAAKATEIIGAYLEGIDAKEIKKPVKGILLIGNEAHGISDDLAAYVTQKVTIPRYGNNKKHAESLNASIATAILCYEFRR